MTGLPQDLLGPVTQVEDDVEQWPIEYRRYCFSATVYDVCEYRLGVVEPAGHPRILATLAGEQPGRFGGVVGESTKQPGGRAVINKSVEQLRGGLPRVGYQSRAVLQVGPGFPRRPADIGQGSLRVGAQPVPVLRGERDQGSGAARRQRKHVESRVGVAVGRLRWRVEESDRFRGLFEDDVGVGARESERAHSGDAGSAGARPGRGLIDHPDRETIPGDVWRGGVEVQILRQQAVFQGQHDLEDTGHSGRGFQMTDVGLDRADQQWISCRPSGPKCGTGGLSLDRVAQRSARSVGLEVSDLGGCQSGGP